MWPPKGGVRLVSGRPDARLCVIFAIVPGFSYQIFSANKEANPVYLVLSHKDTRCKGKFVLMLRSALLLH